VGGMMKFDGLIEITATEDDASSNVKFSFDICLVLWVPWLTGSTPHQSLEALRRGSRISRIYHMRHRNYLYILDIDLTGRVLIGPWLYAASAFESSFASKLETRCKF
jgi:hypothetical protein